MSRTSPVWLAIVLLALAVKVALAAVPSTVTLSVEGMT